MFFGSAIIRFSQIYFLCQQIKKRKIFAHELKKCFACHTEGISTKQEHDINETTASGQGIKTQHLNSKTKIERNIISLHVCCHHECMYLWLYNGSTKKNGTFVESTQLVDKLINSRCLFFQQLCIAVENKSIPQTARSFLGGFIKSYKTTFHFTLLSSPDRLQNEKKKKQKQE